MKLDHRDKRILFELDKNSRITLTELAKKLKTSKEVIHYRINNLVKSKIILKFHTVPSTYRFGLSAYKVYLRLYDTSNEKFDEIITFLKANKDIFWIGVTKGRWDLIFGVWANNMEEFFHIHDQVLEKFSQHIQEKELSISRETFQYNRRWLYSDSTLPEEFTFGEKEARINLDEHDKKILDVLTNNSREKIIEIAKQTNISTDMTSYRIKKMEKHKIIRGYKCLWNASKMGFTTCKAFIYFKNITDEKKNAFITHCKLLKNTINTVVTFAPWDLEVMFETNSYEDFFQIMDEIKNEHNDIIRQYESVLITQEPKQVFTK